MKRFVALCSVFALAMIAMVGCSSRDDTPPQVNPKTVQRVDPLAPVAGQPAPATPQGEVALTRNFYIVFDGSGSMSGDRIRRAKAATKAFLQSLPADVNIGLYVFDSWGQSERVALGPNNKATVEAAVDKVDVGGGTPLGAAIRHGTGALVAQYKKQLGYGDYRLIVITDGAPDSMRDMEDAVTDAAKYGMPICTIGIGIGPNHALRKYSLSYKDTENAAELAEALKEAVGELEAFDADSFKK
jgi:Ca-activated chloride channel homolog